MKRLPFLVLLLSVLPSALRLQADPLDWLNAERRAAGAPSVSADALLVETASLWASRLAAAGVLSHRGGDGSTALDRYRALGGTEVRVGEILGAGKNPAAIEAGWMKSDDHRRLALSPDWTHAGWGMSASGASVVIVMMFTRKLVDPLSVVTDASGLTVEGRFVSRSAIQCVLSNGLEQVQPSEWRREDGSFRFDVPAASLAGYLRLGYVGADGRFTLTNAFLADAFLADAFTLPRETEFPGASSRFEAPAPSP